MWDKCIHILISRIVESKANTLTLQQSVLHLALGGEMAQGNSMLVNCTERVNKRCIYNIRECGSTLYVGMAQGVSFSLYIGIGAKFENTPKTGERRLRTAEYRTVLL